MSIRKKTTSVTAPESEQVEQLLQAAQDEVLLNLSVDSHMSRVTPDYLQSDLDRRFQALRSRPSLQSPAKQKERPRRPVIDPDDVDQELRNVLGDDLSARFAALKAPSSSSSSANGHIKKDEAVPGSGKSDGYGATQEGEEDEVDKLIRWATDAARLDPSPLSEEEDEGHDEEEDDDDDDDDSEDDDLRKSKRKMASKKSSRGE